MTRPDSKLLLQIKKHPLLSKVLIAFTLTVLFASVHFLQRFGWTQATGRQLLSKDVVLIYSGYLLLAPLSILVFAWHKRIPIRRSGMVFSLIYHALAAVVFSALHSLLFSILYYALNPLWHDYSFWLLYKDIVFNYFNLGLAFYLGSLLLSQLTDSYLRTGTDKEVKREILKVKDQSKTYLFPLHDIAYFTSADNYVKVHCDGRAVLMRESMSSLEKRLDPNTFLRVHRTVMVNRNFVSQIVRSKGQTKLVMTDEAELPMSRRRKDALSILENPDAPAIDV